MIGVWLNHDDTEISLKFQLEISEDYFESSVCDFKVKLCGTFQHQLRISPQTKLNYRDIFSYKALIILVLRRRITDSNVFATKRVDHMATSTVSGRLRLVRPKGRKVDLTRNTTVRHITKTGRSRLCFIASMHVHRRSIGYSANEDGVQLFNGLAPVLIINNLNLPSNWFRNVSPFPLLLRQPTNLIKMAVIHDTKFDSVRYSLWLMRSKWTVHEHDAK